MEVSSFDCFTHINVVKSSMYVYINSRYGIYITEKIKNIPLLNVYVSIKYLHQMKMLN